MDIKNIGFQEIQLPTLQNASGCSTRERIVTDFLTTLEGKDKPEGYSDIVQKKDTVAEIQKRQCPYDVEKELILAGLRGPQPMFTNYFVESAQRRFHYAFQDGEYADRHIDAFCICRHWAELEKAGPERALTTNPTPAIETACHVLRHGPGNF
jgi:hypothetical protein